jgi:hypothetical protein
VLFALAKQPAIALVASLIAGISWIAILASWPILETETAKLFTVTPGSARDFLLQPADRRCAGRHDHCSPPVACGRMDVELPAAADGVNLGRFNEDAACSIC